MGRLSLVVRHTENPTENQIHNQRERDNEDEDEGRGERDKE